MKNITGRIECEAQLPLVSEGDGNKAEGRSLTELIKADQYIRSLSALRGTNCNGGPRSAWGGVRMAVAVPPGSV